jgi:peptidylamidoglycolate lyase
MDMIAAYDPTMAPEDEILGQGAFRYRVNRFWGRLDRKLHPVRDCHGIAEDSAGRIVALTNDTHNNLIAYDKSGLFNAAWEARFPGAHGLEITQDQGEDRIWITDHDRRVVSVCNADGDELRTFGAECVASAYTDINRYRPTNTAVTCDGDFFVSDGYGASLIHHFDCDGRYVVSFGGEGPGPEHLKQPHGVWVDNRTNPATLLVCDRGNDLLKWFSLSGTLLRTVRVPGAMPSNVASFTGARSGHIAIACLSGMILILDSEDRILSVVGGEAPRYSDGQLRTLRSFNYVFNHPHDVHVDEQGALYVAQWWSNRLTPSSLNL